jgi:hypothetical protein
MTERFLADVASMARFVDARYAGSAVMCSSRRLLSVFKGSCMESKAFYFGASNRSMTRLTRRGTDQFRFRL